MTCQNQARFIAGTDDLSIKLELGDVLKVCSNGRAKWVAVARWEPQQQYVQGISLEKYSGRGAGLSLELEERQG